MRHRSIFICLYGLGNLMRRIVLDLTDPEWFRTLLQKSNA
jgi:hypothetical protein